LLEPLVKVTLDEQIDFHEASTSGRPERSIGFEHSPFEL
jgi:hypothetical protein